MATVAVSSGCFGFSNDLAWRATWAAISGLGRPVRTEVVVPRWGVPRRIMEMAASVHYPIQIQWDEKPGEKLYWDVLHGGPAANPAHRLGLPMVIHAPSVEYILRKLGPTRFARQFGGSAVWLENIEPEDPDDDPIGVVLRAAKVVRENSTATVGACYDVGHAALHAAAIKKRLDAKSFGRKMIQDLERLKPLGICAAHIHDFAPDAPGQRDHKPLGEGILNFVDIVTFLLRENNDIQLTLEVNHAGSYMDMVAMRAFGHNFRQAYMAAVKDLGKLDNILLYRE